MTNVLHQPAAGGSSVLTVKDDGRGAAFTQGKWLCGPCNGGWMSIMETAALPTVAALVRREAVSLTPELQRVITEWLLAVTILRAQVDPAIQSFDSGWAYLYREQGLDALTVGAWLVHAGVDLKIRDGQGLASTYLFSTEATGAAAIYWLNSAVFVVATGQHLEVVRHRMSGIAPAVTQLWPQPKVADWPPRNSVLDSAVLRAAGSDDDTGPRRLIDHTKRTRGREQRYILRVDENATNEELLAHKLADLMRDFPSLSDGGRRTHPNAVPRTVIQVEFD